MKGGFSWDLYPLKSHPRASAGKKRTVDDPGRLDVMIQHDSHLKLPDHPTKTKLRLCFNLHAVNNGTFWPPLKSKRLICDGYFLHANLSSKTVTTYSNISDCSDWTLKMNLSAFLQTIILSPNRYFRNVSIGDVLFYLSISLQDK